MKKILLCAVAAVTMCVMFVSGKAEACSRVVYTGSDTTLIVVGRTLDWKTPIPTNLYVYPRGIAKQGSDGKDAIRWTSKYGAVYAVGYDGGVTEGMNEKGLIINGLFCKGTVYVNAETAGRPGMSMAMFVAWLLDLNQTTKEVTDVLRKQNFTISGASFDNGTVSALHWGITDAEGNEAIVEFVDGNITIYEGRNLPVLTNDPTYPQMKAINDYWQKVGGTNMLPGTVKSPDRFVRAWYFNDHVEKVADPDLAVSIVRTIMMNVSVPYKYAIETEPNVSSTQWRSYGNLREKRYYFDVVTHPGLIYVDLKKMDLRKGAPVMKLDVDKASGAVGEVNTLMRPTEGFTPMY